jgi:hypothetical protein
MRTKGQLAACRRHLPPPCLQVKLTALQGEAAEQAATARELAARLARANEEASAQQLAAAGARQQAELLQQKLNASKERAGQLESGRLPGALPLLVPCTLHPTPWPWGTGI